MIDFISTLRSIADELRPFTQSANPSSRSWNGTAYVKAGGESPEPFALAWCATLNTIADLIEAQDAQLSLKQVSYLERILFGWMGSRQDFYLDKDRLGESANKANNEIKKKTNYLFESFLRLKSK